MPPSGKTVQRLQCKDCQRWVEVSAGEQEFFAKKRFPQTPVRCEPCRRARKQARRERPTAERVSPSDTRTRFDTSCTTCGAVAKIPFRPAPGRSVLCSDCYLARQQQGSSYGEAA